MRRPWLLTALLAPLAVLAASVDFGEHCIKLKPTGGVGEISDTRLEWMRTLAGLYGVFDDLQAFTGLERPELDRRLQRKGHMHFAVEHGFWRPISASELSWYYRGSVSYLFANSLHPVEPEVTKLTAQDGPVLEFSGGVGTNVLSLADRGIQSYYFGIGLMERDFAEFRVQRRGWSDRVTFIRPFAVQRDGKLGFDAIYSVPQDAQFRTILLFDVLEHVPAYPELLKHLVDCLRVGGRIIERSPFEGAANSTNIHIGLSVPLAEAMGPRMKLVSSNKLTQIWEKLSV